MKRRLTRALAIASAAVGCITAFVWWGQRTPGKYLCELQPVDSFAASYAYFLELDSAGGGRIWSLKPRGDDSPVQLHVTDDGEGFTMSGDGVHDWRTVTTKVHKIEKMFGRLEVTVVPDSSQTTNPEPRAYRFEKILLPPAFTPLNLVAFGLFLSPGLLWILLGYLIESPKTFSVWCRLTEIGLWFFCILSFLVLGFVDKFYSVARYAFMPVLAMPICLWMLNRLKTRSMATHESDVLCT